MNSPRPKLREPREQLPHFDGRREAVARLLAAYQSPQADRHAAWHAFHAAYCGPVRAFACRCGVTDEDLGDCVQEVWAELLLRLPTFQFDPKRGAFDSWLFQIVRGKAADLRRSRVRHRGRENGATLQELIDARPCPARVLEQREFLSVAWEQVRNLLSGPNFEVLRMRLEGRPVAEVAAALGLNVEQVWYRYHRARRELEGLGAAWARGGALGRVARRGVVEEEKQNAEESAQGNGADSVSRNVRFSSLAFAGSPCVDYVFQRVELGRRELSPEWKIEWNCETAPKPVLFIRKCAVVAYAEICGPSDLIAAHWPRIVSAALGAGVAAGIATIIATPTAALPVFQTEFRRQLGGRGAEEERVQVALSARQEANGPWVECKG